jgi:hypothetical protein
MFNRYGLLIIAVFQALRRLVSANDRLVLNNDATFCLKCNNIFWKRNTTDWGKT